MGLQLGNIGVGNIGGIKAARPGGFFARVAVIVSMGMVPVSGADQPIHYEDFDINVRSFYFNREREDLPSSIALTQALMLRYDSPYFGDVIGFNASGFANLKLAAENGEGETDLLQDKPDGNQDSYAKLAEIFVKFKLPYASNLDIGRMELRTPLLNDPDFRATPTTSQASIFSIQKGGLRAYAAVSDKGVAYTETEFSNYTDANGDQFNIYVLGADFVRDANLNLSAAVGQADNVMNQVYLKAGYSWGFGDEQKLTFEAYQYLGRANGEGALAGIGPDYSSSLSNIVAHWARKNTKWTISLQTVNGDDYQTSWDGGVHDNTSFYSWQSVQRLNFDQGGEDSWQLRYDYTFKDVLPGFRVMARYISGDNIERVDGSSGSEWERDIDIAYRPPKLENLALIWRYAVVRSSETFDSDEHRLILNYSFKVL